MPLRKFFAASIRSNSGRGNASPVSTCRVMCRSTSHSQQKFSMNCDGSSTASHSTPWMPDTPATSTRGEELVQPVAELVEDRDHFVVRERRGLAADRRRQIARQVRDRMLHRGARTAAVDRVVHPRAALLALARVEVEVELADELAVAVVDVEEAHGGMPCCRARFLDPHAVDRLHQAEEAGQHLVFGKVLPHFLLGERIALGLEPLGGKRDVPRLQLGEIEVLARERVELREVAFRERLGAACEVAQERDHLVGALRHLRHQRDLGVVRVTEQSRGGAPLFEDARDERTVVPRGVGAQLGRARRVRLVHAPAQVAVLRVLQDGQVARHAQGQEPAGLAGRGGRVPRFRQHVGRDAREFGFAFDVQCPRVGGIEQVFLETRRQIGQILLQRLVARPCRRRSSSAPPRRKSRSSLSMSLRFAASSAANAGASSRSARYFA